MSDFLIDMSVAVLLRLLADKSAKSKWRRAMLKVFKAIASAYPRDAEFTQAAALVIGEPK